MPDSQHHITTDEGITALLERVHTVAVLGIKTADSQSPAYGVPRSEIDRQTLLFPIAVADRFRPVAAVRPRTPLPEDTSRFGHRSQIHRLQ